MRSLAPHSVLLLSLLSGSPAWAVFTGNDHFDRDDLNTEAHLDPEHFLDLLAYRPFWIMPPGETEPTAYFRTTEGSITSDQLHIWREAGVRGKISDRSFMGYRLWQRNDLEEDFFYQLVEAQGPITKGWSWRFIGEPVAKKQFADIGLGSVLAGSAGRLLVDFTLVDFLFNQKDVRNEHDQRKLYNWRAHYQSPLARRWVMDAWFEHDTPVAREFRDEDQTFGHRNTQGILRFSSNSAEWIFSGRDEHRSIDQLTTGGREQDFEKETYRAEAARKVATPRGPLRLALQLHRRHARYIRQPDTTASMDRVRWEADPYVTHRLIVSPKISFENGLYFAGVWEKIQQDTATADRKFSFQAKAKTGLRFDFTPAVALVLVPTWDLDQFFTRRSFDGGNVQFQAHLP